MYSTMKTENIKALRRHRAKPSKIKDNNNTSIHHWYTELWIFYNNSVVVVTDVWPISVGHLQWRHSVKHEEKRWEDVKVETPLTHVYGETSVIKSPFVKSNLKEVSNNSSGS